MTDFQQYDPKVVLAVGAHADDIDFAASGSIAKWSKNGAEVHYLVITDGSKGSDDPKMTSEQLIALRKQEQLAAAKVLGAKEVHFLGYEDGMLEVTMNLKKDIVRIIRQVKPDTVLVFDPSMIFSSELGFVNHPDHRAAAHATMDAVYPLARDHLSFPELFHDEQLGPHKTEHLLFINFEHQNFYVDISETFQLKVIALSQHSSQFPAVEDMMNVLSERASALGGKTGSQYAEAFIRLDIPEE